MEELLVHRGGTLLKRDELDLIKVPEPTNSYVPVSHYHLTDKLVNISTDILRDYTLVGETYAVARQGNQMFAVLKFQGDCPDMALAIAFRNSYDYSMSLGIAMGASVFICDNLALQGEIVIMRKHTKNVWNELEEMAIANLFRSKKNFDKIVADSELFKGKPLENDEAFRLMGTLFGHNIISPRQITALKDEWLRPTHPEFGDRNMWSFLNSTTEALKTCPPVSIMEKHVQAYHLLAGNI